ncbi:MAG: Rieske 2Fe-2S domain-containing protein [Deltaproteobacteria bacterium]|nr:Rieske 2Fe-2S domain-containing protein [Deltaproteobacteria bacterium]
MPYPDLTGHFHPVLKAKRLGAGPARVELGGQAYVLFRDASGTPGALHDRCPHRFAPLSAGRVRKDGRLACGYHGWHFDRAGQGQSPSQPSLRRCDVEALQVVERWGWLWIAAERAPISAFPDLDVAGWDLAGGFTTRFEAPLHVVFDNFSEDEHTPWVHNFLGWTEAGAGEIDFDCQGFSDRTEVRYSAPQRPSPWLPLLFIKRGDRFHNQWVSRFSPVHTVYTLHWTDPKTGQVRPIRARIPIFFVPETERTTVLHTFVFTQLASRGLRPLMPVIRAAGLAVAWNEVSDDARFISKVADTPFELRGMRLGRFDEPLIKNHRLLESIYLGADAPPLRSEAQPRVPRWPDPAPPR